MSLFRAVVSLAAGTLVVAVALTEPARAATQPTTIAVDGTIEVVAIDSFGDSPRADHLYTLVTDDGSTIPVDLDGEVAARTRFRGELVVAGDVASALDAKDLLPRPGTTIDEDTRAGRVAVAAAAEEEAPLSVADATVRPVTSAAVTTPAAHRTYVAVLDNRGSLEESDTQVRSAVDAITGYWSSESGGAITSFAIQDLRRFSSAVAGTTSQSCGMGTDPRPVWNEAASLFPSVSFASSSRNHLVVVMADECSGSGVAGVAEVGTDFSSGGRMSISMGTIAIQVGVHELGHTFGLGHANLDACSSDCEYWDLYSPMGLAVSGSGFAPPVLGTLYRARLGATAAGEVATVTPSSTPQTFGLAPRSAASGLRGLVVTDPSSGATYSVDWRDHAGRDAATFYGSRWSFGGSLPTYPAGVVVERQGADGDIHLATRPGSSQAVGSFAAGTTFAPSAALTVTVDAIGSTAAVTIRSGGSTPPVVAPPPGGTDGTGSAAAPPPASLVAATPRIRGTAKVGRTLRARTGSWSPTPSFRYQWYANGKRITSKGTRSWFKLTSKQRGKRITVRVTGVRSGYTTVRVLSRATKKVARR